MNCWSVIYKHLSCIWSYVHCYELSISSKWIGDHCYERPFSYMIMYIIMSSWIISWPLPVTLFNQVLFRSARTSCRTFDFPVHPSRDNFSWVHIYRHTCLMDHQKSHQTNPMAQRDPIDAPLTPWDPVGLPLDPLRPCSLTPWPPGTR